MGTTMNSSAVDIADYLESSAIGSGTLGIDMFVSKMPDSPDSCIALYDTGGFAPESSDVVYDKPTIQIRVRGLVGKYKESYNKCAELKTILHKLHGLEIGNSRYIGIWAMSDILFLGYDEKNRPEFTMNFRIHRTTN